VSAPQPVPESDWTAWIVSQRPARAAADPFKPYGFSLEQERAASGRNVSSAGILLTNKECPWRCLMCDLWKHTLTQPTPRGAIPRQIDYALEQLGSAPEQLKLYNAGSFFDVAAIPPADCGDIATRISFARHVVVESHPRLVGERTRRFRDLLSGSLEVAMGLETVHPQVSPRLNKRFSLDDFARASEFLSKNRIGIRAFILVQPPFLRESEAVLWAIKSAEFAFACGASAVSLIPTRRGNGALDRLMQTGEFSPPRIETLEQALDAVVALKQGRGFGDTWDLEHFSTCSLCLTNRIRRLEATNLTQEVQPPAECEVCGSGQPRRPLTPNPSPVWLSDCAQFT
jgi:archaeosine synthase beta-subunit